MYSLFPIKKEELNSVLDYLKEHNEDERVSEHNEGMEFLKMYQIGNTSVMVNLKDTICSRNKKVLAKIQKDLKKKNLGLEAELTQY